MKRRISLVITLIFIIIISVVVVGCGGGKDVIEYRVPESDEVVDDAVFGKAVVNQAIMILETGNDLKDAEEIAKEFNGEIVGEIEGLPIYQMLLETDNVDSLIEVIDALNLLESVNIAAMDALITSDDMQGVLWTPIDSYAYEYKNNALMAFNMGFPDAWRYLTGAMIDYEDVKIGVMDSAVNINSQELKGDIQFDLTYTDEAGRDLTHATKVINIIAANPFDVKGMTGVASFLRDSLTIVNKDIMAGVDKNDEYAILFGIMKNMVQLMEEDVTIFNCSFGPYTIGEHNKSNVELFRQFAEMTRSVYPEVLFIASAGNDNGVALTGTNHYPGGIPASNILTVASLDVSSDIAYFSNIQGEGGEVSLAAYGSDMLVGSIGDEVYIYGSGTSFSAPYVTATAALVRSIYPPLLSGEDLKYFLIDMASTTALSTNLKSEVTISKLVGGKVLSIDTAVLEAINLKRELLFESTYTPDQLFDITDVKVRAVSEADGYRVEAYITDNDVKLTTLSISSYDDYWSDEGESSYEVTPDDLVSWMVEENKESIEEVIWVQREDTYAMAYVVLNEELLNETTSVQQSGYPDMIVFDGRLSVSKEAIGQLKGDTDAAKLLDKVFVWNDTIGNSADYPNQEDNYGWWEDDDGIKRNYKSPTVKIKVNYHDGTMIKRIDGAYEVDGIVRKLVIAFGDDGTIEELTNDRYNEDGYVSAQFQLGGHLYRYEEIIGDRFIATTYYTDTYTIEYTQESRKIDGNWLEDGNYIHYYRNGVVGTYREMFEGKKHGLYEKYDENNNLLSSEHYANDLLNGEVKKYRETSKDSGVYYLEMEANYLDGKRSGIMTRWHPGKQLNSKFEYEDDALNGSYEEYTEGVLLFSGQTANDEAVGTWIEYKTDGSVHGRGSVTLKNMSGSIAHYIIKEPDWVYE
jgi:antitoxin component YwqK of YwqJK toxin-antitoxin module